MTAGLPLDEGIFVSMKEVKQIRRKAVEALITSRRNNTSATGLAAGPVRMNLHEELISRSQYNLPAIKHVSSAAQVCLSTVMIHVQESLEHIASYTSCTRSLGVRCASFV